MITIGTRDSKLAVWQATQVQLALQSIGILSQLNPTKSAGDIDLVTPLYEMGVQGVFTRSLDIALLSGKIDIAVHSMKDVPTALPKGIVQAAVLPRGPVQDVLIYQGNSEQFINTQTNFHIATGSIRRKAQWLNKYPNTQFYSLRGNMQTRMDKLHESTWNGAIFAKAGLHRIGLLPENYLPLHWMLPAPAQGAVMVVCRADDAAIITACQAINHVETAACVQVERDFLRALMGGCSTPISALTTLENNQFVFKGNICSPNGAHSVSITKNYPLSMAETAGASAAESLKQQGIAHILDAINSDKK